jgi:hypothetical protein
MTKRTHNTHDTHMTHMTNITNTWPTHDIHDSPTFPNCVRTAGPHMLQEWDTIVISNDCDQHWLSDGYMTRIQSSHVTVTWPASQKDTIHT